MKACFLVMLPLLGASFSPVEASAQFPYKEQQVIAYAKSIDVRTLDPSLPSQRLEDWLQSGPPQAHIEYWKSDCDLKEPEAADNPVCAKIGFSRNGEWGYLLVQVGTSLKGIAGPPQLWYGVAVYEEGTLLGTGHSDRLSGLPALLDQPPVTGGVRKLYEEIGAHHPIGIPAGAEKAAIWPLLSKRLASQLETAQACQDDYASQHPEDDGASKPKWLKSGIFSGDGNRAFPAYSTPLSREKQSDGSFLVDVNLIPQEINVKKGHIAKLSASESSVSADKYLIEARVVDEGGQFVVDDIRIFDRYSTDSPSHLLSESFAGCNGPHWTGLATASR
ncbi:MAG: hypothetical protein ABSE51_16140 [Terracidiphilus sp.]|jgi:hypothetical protein